MDIKNVRNIYNQSPVSRSDTPRQAQKADGNHDRDGNGQNFREENPRRQLNQQEVEAAVKVIRQLRGVRDNDLVVHAEQNEAGQTIVYIQDNLGKVIRRIPQPELSSLLSSQDKEKGYILNRES